MSVMKIYTEIVWSWDNDKGELVQESSKFYDYEGSLTLAAGPGGMDPDPTTPAVDPPIYLEYPSNIGFRGGPSETDNWISFEGTGFISQKTTLDIALYIPGDSLNTSYKSEYESVALGGLGAMADKGLKALSLPGPSGSGGMSIEGIKNVLSSTASAATSEAQKVGLLKAGDKANLLIEGSKTIIERAQGAVLNPYIVAAYKGPTDMRTHDFTFQMLPQSAQESRACVKIAKAFKNAMLPSHAESDSATAPSMLFGYPDQFEITFTVNGKEMPKTSMNPMFNIGRSVLTACDLDYTTESVALFFDNTQYPVSISMKLSFMELELMHRGKVQQGF